MHLRQDILSTLAYFDLFDYPITQTELFLFLPHHYEQEDFSSALQELETDNWLYRFGDLYSLQNDYSLVIRRRKGNVLAKQMMVRADRIAGFLSLFPFVRGVAISGSLSKNFADERSDIDFFIITAASKLWLARTFMHLFKKITFLFNRQDWFCMNYYVDEAGLEIKEKNIYTAVEVVTLLPLRGIQVFEDFYAANRWTRDYLPNHSLKISYVEEIRKPVLKKISEFFLNNSVSQLFEKWLMQYTSYRWQLKKKRQKRNAKGMVMGMDASAHYAKPDPEHFQMQLLSLYQTKLSALFRKFSEKRIRIN